jgi:hydroxymethylglutaryl-CoA lyase
MEDLVKIVECPRDAWQGLPVAIPTEKKAAYLRDLIEAGFTHIDAVSFVSPAAVPQMADSERVLELLNPPEGVEIIGIVVNRKGAERAIRSGSVIRSPPNFFAAINIRRRENRCMSWKRRARWLKTRD